MNIIPHSPGSTPGYFCTWSTQNAYARILHRDPDNPRHFYGAKGARLARDTMCEANLSEWLGQHPLVRQDLYFMLDDGWDVPFTRSRSLFHNGIPFHFFGSLELNEERFPSFSGTPAERLRKLNDAVKQAGWKGLGIWVCAHNAAKKAQWDIPGGFARYRKLLPPARPVVRRSGCKLLEGGLGVSQQQDGVPQYADPRGEGGFAEAYRGAFQRLRAVQRCSAVGN